MAKRSSRRRSSRSRRRSSKKRGLPLPSLTLDQWLDILGIILILLALLTVLSFLSVRGALTGAWLNFLKGIFGWGVFVVPIGIGGVGLWLILRRFEDKQFSLEPERVVGLVLAFLAALATFHFFAGILHAEELDALADQGIGGGHLGLFLDKLLLGAVGGWGAAVVLLALWTLALMLSASLSLLEIAWLFNRAVSGVRQRLPRRASTPMLKIDPPRTQTKPSAQRSKTQAERQPKPQSAPSTQPTDGSAAFSRTHVIGGRQEWQLPDIHQIFDVVGEQELSEAEIRERVKIIEETLNSFGVPGKVVEVNRGPVITQFGVEPGFIEGRGDKKTKVKVSRISALADDLALALAAPSIRIEAPVPGRSVVGVEVPNADVALVGLLDVIESQAFKNSKSPLRLALGQDVSGGAVIADLTAMPHLLIAGTTGSGKSVCINAMIACLLSFNTPDQLKFLMVDPKRVELTNYNGIPHLITPVVVDLERVVGTLQWVTREMDKRYRMFAKAGARNISDYNQRASGSEEGEILPYIIVVIDELADLMMLAPDETERTVCRLAQMARATGIHLIIATQRPSVDVVTGLIKANFPARISFAVASAVDSRVVLDMVGAERLLGRGDMLYMSPDASQPLRLQGTFVSDPELQRLVRHWKGVRGVTEAESKKAPSPSQPLKQQPLWEEMRKKEEEAEPEDVLLNEAIEVVQEAGRASISLLQRRLRIGYVRAARLIDLMEEKEIVGPQESSNQAREVLVDEEYVEDHF